MIVADTNLIAYNFVEGLFTEDAQRVLARDSDWRAPPQWRGELLNVPWFAARHTRISPAAASETYVNAAAFVRTTRRPHFRAVLGLAIRSDCSP